jgi:hypothetical protein
MNDLGANRELMLLASNLPHTSVRSELLKGLHRQWLDGTTPFESAKITLDSIRDPGFLLLVKSMPREQPKPTTPATAAAKPSREQQAKYAWMNAAESFLRALNGRLLAASRNRPKPGPEEQLAIAPHKGLPVVAEYRLQWPEALAERMPGAAVDPLLVHYLRMEGNDRFQRVSDFFRRQLDSPAGRNVARGQWLDSLQSDAAAGKLRSVDVLITRDEPPPRNPTATENLVVEVLWIEIADPTGKSSTITQGKID